MARSLTTEQVQELRQGNASFGSAIEALKQGCKVARSGWNGSGMFAVLSPGAEKLPSDKFFNKDLGNYADKIGGFMDVRPSFMLKTAQDDVAYWTPSGSDCLAEDWTTIEESVKEE